MKLYIKFLLAISIFTSLASCKKFLDVRPEDAILEDELFSTKKGINTALNGIYINLAKNELYGQQLTMSTVEILAQRYNVSGTHADFKTATYAYNDKPTVDAVDNIWSGAYASIININVFLDNLDKYKGVLDEQTEKIYRGEVIGIRAMLHFDMLRLFGPMYNSADSLKTSIPYYSGPKVGANPLLPANQVMAMIAADLKQAEDLLSADAIITTGPNVPKPEQKPDFLTGSRNYRMNYFAVKALQARVNMYRGNKIDALAAAKLLIQNQSKFPWTSTRNALSEKINPDRVFTTEMILGIQNSRLYNNYDNLFSPALQEKNILAPLPGRLTTVFESNENDYRYNLNWTVPSNGGKTYRTFYKYADIINKDSVFRYSVPLVKMSEMYYIATECEDVAATAIGYLNTVRANRGLLPLAATVNKNTELQKEYQKEFYGEGQLFYYYKRRNLVNIPNGAAASGNVAMNALTYVVPLPKSETDSRQ